MANSIFLLSPPSIEPVSLAEIKAQARIDSPDEDALLGTYITAARQWVEMQTRRSLITQTWRLWLDLPIADAIALPYPPVQSVAAVTLWNTDNASSVVNDTLWRVEPLRESVRLIFTSPTETFASARPQNGAAIDIIAGYGNSASDVPAALRLAIMQLATHWHHHRGEAMVGGLLGNVPLVINELLAPFRIHAIS